jgi:hypothetical protein
MPETYRPDRLTPCTPLELYAALAEAWPEVIGDECTRGALVLLVAHWGLETGFGHYMHWYNLGNAKHVRGDGHDYTGFRHNEILHGATVWLDADPAAPGFPSDPFVAFDTLEQGAEFYLALVDRHFTKAWPDVEAGDVAHFCHDLKLQGYYTADEAVYTAGVLRCYHQVDAMIPQPAAPTLPSIPAPELVRDELLDAQAQDLGNEPPPETA